MDTKYTNGWNFLESVPREKGLGEVRSGEDFKNDFKIDFKIVKEVGMQVGEGDLG